MDWAVAGNKNGSTKTQPKASKAFSEAERCPEGHASWHLYRKYIEVENAEGQGIVTITCCKECERNG